MRMQSKDCTTKTYHCGYEKNEGSFIMLYFIAFFSDVFYFIGEFFKGIFDKGE